MVLISISVNFLAYQRYSTIYQLEKNKVVSINHGLYTSASISQTKVTYTMSPHAHYNERKRQF